jgi:hypothetical protein
MTRQVLETAAISSKLRKGETDMGVVCCICNKKQGIFSRSFKCDSQSTWWCPECWTDRVTAEREVHVPGSLRAQMTCAVCRYTYSGPVLHDIQWDAYDPSRCICGLCRTKTAKTLKDLPAPWRSRWQWAQGEIAGARTALPLAVGLNGKLTA